MNTKSLIEKKVVVSCAGKFHAFALAEQLNKHKILERLFTSYAFQKNVALRALANRIDREQIPKKKISTNPFIAFKMKLSKDDFLTMEAFDKWVAKNLIKINADFFIGWSGMSLNSLNIAKEKGMLTILERGSSHIEYQNKILKDEYKLFGKEFEIDKRFIDKELKEYDTCDYISIPSNFVKRSFLLNGVKEEKLILNPYGSSSFFKPIENKKQTKFKILYLGGLNIRKGLKYLFEGLNQLNIPIELYEVWFIGNVSEDLKYIIENSKKENWKFFGHINHYDLPRYISQCDIAIQPSLEEGLSMVIPQILQCGVPMIVSTNSGGEDIVLEGKTGFIVPIKNSKMIADRISQLFQDENLLQSMKEELKKQTSSGLMWDDYGYRYIQNLSQLNKLEK